MTMMSSENCEQMLERTWMLIYTSFSCDGIDCIRYVIYFYIGSLIDG